jgi:histidinol-phosphate aminotransferase
MTAPRIIQRARRAILALKAYSSARSLAQPDPATVFLDANELPAEPLIGVKGYACYSPQQPPALMKALAEIYGVAEDRIMASRGADEAIDVLIRAFCEARRDNIVICPPTFPMYAQSARWQGAEIKTAKLKADFSPDAAAILKKVDKKTKIVFLCSPNNPTGGIVKKDVVVKLCKALKDKALVALDEAYIEFCPEEARTALLGEYDNLVIFRTLSKGYALAGVRCGAMLAHPEIVALCRKVLAPYPLAVPALEIVLKTLAEPNRKRLALKRQEILATRDWFLKKLKIVPGITRIYPSDANYVLVRCKDAKKILATSRENGFILRDQSHQPTLENCVRISMGTREQMDDLLHILKTGKRAPTKAGRRAAITRRTNETAISVTVDLDHADPVHISTGIGFYDHMLEQVAKHGGFSLVLECAGDLHIDAHHTIEDCAIALGQALKTALGDKAGIGRYGFTVPMDEARAQAVIDLSGRGLMRFEGDFPEGKVGDMPTDMVAHIFRSLAENMQATIHIAVDGENTHHMVEGCFKAFGRALRQAIRREGDALPSTKGVL